MFKTLTAHMQHLWTLARDYMDTRITIIQLKATSVIAGLIANVLVTLFIFIAFLFFLMLISIGSALWINHQLASSYTGFLIVAAFYGFICLLLFGLRKQLLKFLSTRYILQKLMKLHEPSN